MNKEQRYFRQQKLYGLSIVLFAVILVVISVKLLVPALIAAAIGLYIIATKEKVFMNSYFCETYEDEEEEI